MPTSLPTSPRRRESRFPLSSVTTLALWRLRRTWFLLFITTLGMIAAVIVICAIPLFSDVMTTAGLRSTLLSTPTSAEVAINSRTLGISSHVVNEVSTQFNTVFRQSTGSQLQPTQFMLQVNDFSLAPAKAHTNITVDSTSLQQAAQHLNHLQGRIAQVTTSPNTDVEIMLTPDTAKRLGLKLGYTLPLALNYLLDQPQPSFNGTQSQPTTHTQLIKAHVVGLFSIDPANSAYWHGENFQASSFVVSGGRTTENYYTLLMPDNALTKVFDYLSSQHHHDAIFSTSVGYTLQWFYRLDTTHLAAKQLDTLIFQLATLQNQFVASYGDLESANTNDSAPLTFPYLNRADLRGDVFSQPNTPSSLQRFQSRVAVTRIPVIVLALQVIALILFFVSLMTSLLIDRQADTIAIIRSRGASSSQVFGALLLQYCTLAVISIVIGLPLAILLTLQFAQHLLPAAEQNATNIITSQLPQALQDTLWYAITIMLVAMLTMGISLFFAARVDVLSLRRDSARSSKRPFWQRLNLDVIAGIIAFVGYAISLYLTTISSVLEGDAKTLVATPLSIIAPFFLMIGILFLFLRVFPLLIRLGAYMAARGPGAVSLLALAQIARTPRQPLRMTMLLAIAISFTLFSLVYTATEAQHMQDIAIYQIGADFSGGLPYATTNSLPLAQTIHKYQSIPGVLAASAGYVGQGQGGKADITMAMRAVDASSFGNAVIWPSADAAQSGKTLLSQLVMLRSTAVPNDSVPTIIDTTAMKALLLHIGSSFRVKLANTALSTLQFTIVGTISHVPTVNDRFTPTTGTGTDFLQFGSMLFDYQSFTAVYSLDAKGAKTLLGPPTPPGINTVWLHTKQDAASLANIRTALNQATLALDSIADRAALLSALATDPLYLILSSILSIGVVTVLALAFIGDMIASWLSARMRLTNFAVLRALGTTPRQIASVLTWEQAIIYVSGLLLGALLGLLLSLTVVPALTFTDLNVDLSTGQFYAAQSAVSTPVVIPTSLPLAIVALILVFSLALWMMVRVVSQPSLSQTLRLNED